MVESKAEAKVEIEMRGSTSERKNQHQKEDSNALYEN
jgi:hypothetical protein